MAAKSFRDKMTELHESWDRERKIQCEVMMELEDEIRRQDRALEKITQDFMNHIVEKAKKNDSK